MDVENSQRCSKEGLDVMKVIYLLQTKCGKTPHTLQPFRVPALSKSAMRHGDMKQMFGQLYFIEKLREKNVLTFNKIAVPAFGESKRTASDHFL